LHPVNGANNRVTLVDKLSSAALFIPIEAYGCYVTINVQLPPSFPLSHITGSIRQCTIPEFSLLVDEDTTTYRISSDEEQCIVYVCEVCEEFEALCICVRYTPCRLSPLGYLPLPSPSGSPLSNPPGSPPPSVLPTTLSPSHSPTRSSPFPFPFPTRLSP
jgi:hypothetical protein